MVATRSHAHVQSVAGDRLVSRLRDLLASNNIRRFTIRDASGNVLLEIPVGTHAEHATLAPEVWGAVGAMSRPDIDFQVVVDWRIAAVGSPRPASRRA
ncbi:MAG TPA: DUF4342 domain-containing protein [Gemmatimonadales bacterium]|jgi:hypothetical protein|nr:DUF4342 domain-containing protein [Gemmatimonadales bacterium]